MHLQKQLQDSKFELTNGWCFNHRIKFMCRLVGPTELASEVKKYHKRNMSSDYTLECSIM